MALTYKFTPTFCRCHNNIVCRIGFPREDFLMDIENWRNTGSPGWTILSENQDKIVSEIY